MTQSPLAASQSWDGLAESPESDLAPLAERCAREAVRLGGLLESHDLQPIGASTGVARPRVIDIGCGAGTASLLASPAASSVEAVDFAPAMIERVTRRAERAGLSNITPRLADAQALPHRDAVFDVAFALFSLIFCPDRPRALREMARVLAPNGKAIVGSFGPMADVPALNAMLRAMDDEIPGLVGAPVELPLSTPALCHAELSAAGFRDIAVHPTIHRGAAESPHAFWWQNARFSPPIVLLRQAMGDADFEVFSEGVVRRLTESLGEGPVTWDSLAYLTVARPSPGPIKA